MPPDPIGPLSGRGYVVLESYDESGAPRLTPVDAVGHGRVIYAWTDSRTNKVKRINANPRVRVALTDLSGKPKGDWFEGEAQLVGDGEMGEALAEFRKVYGPLRYSMFHVVARLRGERLDAVIRMTLAPATAATAPQ